MTTKRRPIEPLRRTPRRAVLAAASLLAALGINGCIEEDPVAATIQEVAGQFEALGAPGSAIPGDEFVTDVYEDALRSLRSVAGQGSDAQRASIQLLMARAEYGLAKIPLGDLTAAHAEANLLIAGAAAQAAKHVRLSALASASATFDPSDEIAELQSIIGERSAAIDDQQASLQRVQTEIAELDGLAGEADARADEIRQQESELRARARAMTAPEAVPLFEQAASLRNQADDLAADAERRRAQADVLRPEITQIEGEIDRLTEQRTLLEESIENLRAESEASRRATASLQTDADAVMQELTARIDAVEVLMTGTMADAYEASMGAYDKASAEARKAASGLRTQARLFEAETALTAAGLAASQAEQLNRLVRTAGSADRMELAERAGTLAEEAAELARSRLESARESFSSAGVRGEASDRIDAVVARLEAIIGIPPETEEDGLDGFEADPVDGPGQQPGQEPGEEPAEDASDAADSEAGGP